MNPKISISSLIYKSIKYADFIYDSIHKYTPELQTGEAEFYFIANDATEEVINHLEKKKYRYYINNNKHYTEDELFKMGYGWPEYMNRVYRGYNESIRLAAGEIIVLVNSDMGFSKDWLKNLLAKLNDKVVVVGKLIEPGHIRHGVFPASLNGTGAFQKNFGTSPTNFKDKEFQEFAESFKQNIITPGGAYMPCCMYKQSAIDVGLYPEGNIAGSNFNHVVDYGDIAFFKKLSAKKGMSHITCWNSIIYHFKEGEKDDN